MCNHIYTARILSLVATVTPSLMATPTPTPTPALVPAAFAATFMQPFSSGTAGKHMPGDWTVARWSSEFAAMKGLGINEVVIQYAAWATEQEIELYVGDDRLKASVTDRLRALGDNRPVTLSPHLNTALEATTGPAGAAHPRMNLILGLWFEKAYEQSGNSAESLRHQDSHWTRVKAMNALIQSWIKANAEPAGKPKSIAGWYLPQEANSQYWPDGKVIGTRLRELAADSKTRDPRPVGLSVYPTSDMKAKAASAIDTEAFGWALDVRSVLSAAPKVADVIWIQDGRGAKSFSEDQARVFLDAFSFMADDGGVVLRPVLEIFEDLNRAVDPADAASRLCAPFLLRARAFGPGALFSWEYLLSDGEKQGAAALLARLQVVTRQPTCAVTPP